MKGVAMGWILIQSVRVMKVREVIPLARFQNEGVASWFCVIKYSWGFDAQPPLFIRMM